jgi:DNA polymerase-3 subunit epsilon
MSQARGDGRQLRFDELGTPLCGTTFCVFDLETTGASPGTDAITEIGAVKVRGGEVVGEFGTLVNPGREIPCEITRLTGIDSATVAGAPAMGAVLPTFLEFAADCVLVAHNARFDTGFLRAACRAADCPPPRHAVVCTLRLARRVLGRGEVRNHKLATLAASLGSGVAPSHRALDDARATVDVLHALLERVGSYGVHSLEELLEFAPDVPAATRGKRSLAAGLPERPGVYLFRGPSDEVLYVGTASNLRRRVRGYFTGSERRTRMREMVALATRVDSVTCTHPLEAAVRELRLLAAHRPAYNRRSKNPRGGWWITLTAEAFPRLSVVRTPRPGALGPVPSRTGAAEIVDTLLGLGGVRACTVRIPASGGSGTPCALTELGRCGAPCAGRQTVADYSPAVEALRGLFTGESAAALERLHAELERLVAEQRFEAASRHRDRLARLVRTLQRRQRLAALCAISELVVARPDGAGGWELAVVRSGRLASAGVAPRGVPPMPVVESLVASAETVVAGDEPLRGAPPEEAGLLSRWLERPGSRLVRTSSPWAQPAGSAGRWHEWAERAAVAAESGPWHGAARAAEP